jgi:hypothetical protein
MASIVAFFVVAALIALPILGLGFFFREKRQAREGRGTGARRGTSPIGAGLMEAQNFLEPDRKIEVVREEERKRDLLVDVHEEGDGKR